MATRSSMTSGTIDPAQRVGATPSRPASVTLGGSPLAVVGTARIYVCGITPYDVTHLGHASTFVWADVLASVIESTGAEARLCRNVTDVDDVLTTAATSKGRYFDEFALTQEALFEQSMRALRVATPHAEPRARHHVDAVLQLAQALLDNGSAYERDGTVWFRGGTLHESAGLGREEALARSEAYGDEPAHPAKDDPFDVVVWQTSSPDHPAWPSPWGWGRPGWHAECAAMALAVHGSSVDVLVGGDDLVFPHHAYQSAMVSAVSGVSPFARASMHVGEVRLGAEKMAKSTGNLVLVDDLLTSCSPAALRLLLLDRRYDRPWSFDPADLTLAEDRLQRLFGAAGKPGSSASATETALERLRTDLDVPGALDLAESEGGDAARRVITLLRLG